MTSGQALVLIGARGVGKTTVGAQLAKRLNAPFVDTDELVERTEARSIVDIFNDDGEEAFRNVEASVIAVLDPDVEQVISTGGGAVIRESNRQLITLLGVVIWLKADTATMVERVAGTDRPALTEASLRREVEEVCEHRAPLYGSIANHVIEVDGRSVEEICDELQQLWREPSNHHLR